MAETAVTKAARSPINWVQLAGIISSVAVFLGYPALDPVEVSKVILGIQAAVSIATVVIGAVRGE